MVLGVLDGLRSPGRTRGAGKLVLCGRAARLCHRGSRVDGMLHGIGRTGPEGSPPRFLRSTPLDGRRSRTHLMQLALAIA